MDFVISFDSIFTNISLPKSSNSMSQWITEFNLCFQHRVTGQYKDAGKSTIAAVTAVQKRQNSYAKSKKDNVAYEMPFPHPVVDDSVSGEDGGNSFGLWQCIRKSCSCCFAVLVSINASEITRLFLGMVCWSSGSPHWWTGLETPGFLWFLLQMRLKAKLTQMHTRHWRVGV